MKCPHCDSEMIKQNPMPQNGSLNVINRKEFEHEWYDYIVDWYRCSKANCPMSVYLSNEAKSPDDLSEQIILSEGTDQP